jgi:hypothetical protein
MQVTSIVAVCVLTLLAVAGGSGTPAQEKLPGNVIEIVAGDYFLEGPDTIPAGLTTFVLRLHSGHHALSVVKLDDGRTVTDFVESYAKRTARPWAQFLGGPGFPNRERPANATARVTCPRACIAPSPLRLRPRALPSPHPTSSCG